MRQCRVLNLKTLRLGQIILILSLCLISAPRQIRAVSSDNYEIEPSSSEAIRHQTSSDNYRLEGAVEPIIGPNTSSAYKIESGSSFAGYCGDGFIDPTEDCEGANLNSQTCLTRGFTGGTLACSASCVFNTLSCTTIRGCTNCNFPPPPPSFDESITAKSFTYLNEINLFGYKATNATHVYVNNSTEDVTYATASRWQKTLALNLGQNIITIKAANNFGFSDEVNHTIKRRLTGDVDDNNVVDDYDFSLLANHWNQDWPKADFTENGIVDDYDLSLMGACWESICRTQ